MTPGTIHRAGLGCAVLLCVLLALPVPSIAQTPSPAPLAAPKEEKTGLTTLGPVELNATGNDAEAELSDLMRQGDGRFLKEVTLIGRGRGVAAPQGVLGQVVWYGIKATVKGEERKAGLSSPLKSAFLAQAAMLPKTQKLEAIGDLEALKEAARRLLAEAAKDEEKETKAGKEEEKAKPETRQVSRQGNAGGTGGTAGSLPPYQPLAYPEKSAETGSSSALVEVVTSEGCKPRVLLDQGVVYLQSKLVTMKEGVIVKDGQCSDSFESIPIQKSYGGCEYAVDIESLQAWPQYRPYYVNAGGEPVYVTECMKDLNAPAAVVKDGTACSPIIDLQNLVATRAYELVYTSMSGGRVVVAGCRPDEGNTLPITSTADGCGYRHDMPNNQSFRQARRIYVDNGVSVAVSSCADDGPALPHVLDTAACQPQIDYTTRKVTPFARRMMQGDLGLTAIAECAPSPELVVDLLVTFQGCERLFVHNLEGGESYRTERFYYEQAGTRSYVGACVTAADAAALPHQLETVSWQNNDTARTALPVTRIYFTWNAEKFEVSSAQVRPDALALPYGFARSETVADLTGTYYEACGKYIPTRVSDVFTRPDGTEVVYANGAGQPQGPSNACVTQSVEMAYVDKAGSAQAIYCRYKGRAVKRREDGETVYGGWVMPGAVGSHGWYLLQELRSNGIETAWVGYVVGAGGAVMAYGDAGGLCYADASGGMMAGFQVFYGL